MRNFLFFLENAHVHRVFYMQYFFPEKYIPQSFLLTRYEFEPLDLLQSRNR